MLGACPTAPPSCSGRSGGTTPPRARGSPTGRTTRSDGAGSSGRSEARSSTRRSSGRSAGIATRRTSCARWTAARRVRSLGSSPVTTSTRPPRGATLTRSGPGRRLRRRRAARRSRRRSRPRPTPGLRGRVRGPPTMAAWRRPAWRVRGRLAQLSDRAEPRGARRRGSTRGRRWNRTDAPGGEIFPRRPIGGVETRPHADRTLPRWGDPSPPGRGADAAAIGASPARGAEPAALDALAATLRERLVDTAGEAGADDDPAARIGALVEREAGVLHARTRSALAARVAERAVGLGPLEPLLRDPAVDELMVCGIAPVWVERGGRLCRTDVRFSSEGELRHAIERILAPLGRRADEGEPLCDARLPDSAVGT